ncbi:MAG: hypothetical protein FWH33_11265 [Oscillospiraceae bacterium]|nr:hypothetical protein [Oscillospiraceae bacterium]
MNKRALQIIPSIVLYIFAGLLTIYAIWSYIYCADIISQAKVAGQLAASGNEHDIASFYMSNCGQYVIFALLLAAAGLILQRKQPARNESDSTVAFPVMNDALDDELDEWWGEEVENDSE